MNGSTKIIEIIGPAGSGKSTLARALSQHCGIILEESPPYYRRPEHIPFFIRYTLESLPTFVKLFSYNFKAHERWLSLQEVAWMVTLKGWNRVLENRTGQDFVIVLDEGPIFHMAFLQIYGPNIINSQFARTWWEQMYKQWSETLDILVYLDASDSVLIERIRSREKFHGVQVKPDEYAFKYLADLRDKYESILVELISKRRNIKVLRFDTKQIPLSQLYSEIIAVL